MNCPACAEKIEVICFRPITPRSGTFECASCGQFFVVDKIDETSNKMELIRINRESVEAMLKEMNML
jgi:transcription elongation factor Elf1